MLEEGLHQFAAVGFKDATGNDGLGVEGTGGIELVAALLVGRTIDDTGNLCPADGSGTHRAGLDGDVEGAVGEILATDWTLPAIRVR